MNKAQRKSKYAIWNRGQLVPAYTRWVPGAIPLASRTAEERRLRLRYYRPKGTY